MIEDLQDELHHEQPRRKERKARPRGALLFFAFMLWILFSAVVILSSLPSMIRAVRESNIQSIVASLKDTRMAALTRSARLCFVIPKSDGSVSLVTCSQRVSRTGASEYHDVMEGLLLGPQKEELSIGAITYIDPDTRLLGLTVSGDTAFVDLSESFTKSGSAWGPNGIEIAKEQIEMTIQALNPSVTRIVVLINGKELAI